MSEPKDTCSPVRRASRGAGVLTWLAGRSRGRWATSRGRWIKTALTGALVLTGLIAWAVALVQPWTVRAAAAGYGTGDASQDLETKKACAATLSLEALVKRQTPPRPMPLRRNPFTLGPAPSTDSSAAEAQAAQPPSAKEVLEAAKTLKLEVILITPAGERWAVINGVNYREGEEVAGLEIVGIQEGHVKLRRAGMTCLLRVD